VTYVITQNCCKDASCVPVCPVDCIRPVGGAGEFTGAEMLYIDPEACVDCGACLEACPVDAIYQEDFLPARLERFKEMNARYFQQHPLDTGDEPVAEPPVLAAGSLRVAIVGAGPAACYAATELLRAEGVDVDLFERLPSPFGLVRAGVAPDHQDTKLVVDIFEEAFDNPRFGCHLNVEVGRDVTHDDLLAHHHAVIYAVGASKSRDLGIPNEQLPGNEAAADFVGWYNGHPDHAGDHFDLSAERAVIVGNGNVALDVARILLLPLERLAKTDIADHALSALAESNIKEVVILGRRGPRNAAFSVGEFQALGFLPGIDVIVDSDELDPHPGDDIETVMKLEVAREFAEREPSPGNKRIVFRFMTTPAEVVGGTRVQGLRVVHHGVDGTGRVVPGVGETELIETSLILRSIGYQGSEIDGLPFDPDQCIIPNDRGRILDHDGHPVPGAYVTGWIKRGPRGVIGTNRTCAEETVARLWEDFDDGNLSHDVKNRDALNELLRQRNAEPVEWSGWCAIDTAERKRGVDASRPRVKFVDVAEMVEASKG
jgi:ferredoxin/flavodoxin---NADP+ reductase